MTPDELRQHFEDAKAAIFRLEEALGPPGHEDRRRAYALRCEIGYLGGAVLKRIEQRPHGPCHTCGALTTEREGRDLTPEEQTTVDRYYASFIGPDGEPVLHTGHLRPELMELPRRWYCSVHRPQPVDQALKRFRPLLAWRSSLTDYYGDDLVSLLLHFVGERIPDPRLEGPMLDLWKSFKDENEDLRVEVIERFVSV